MSAPHRHNGPRVARGIIALLVGLGLVAGCDSRGNDRADHSSTAAPSTQSSSPTPSSAASETTTSDPQAAVIAAAEEKLKCSWATTDAALQQPTKDWYVEIRKCAGDPYLSEMVSTLKYYAAHGVHNEGQVNREIVSSKVVLEQPASVEVTFCLDQSALVVINAQGEKLPDPPTTRRLGTVRVVDYGGVDGFLLQQNVNPSGAAAEQPC